MLKSQKRQRGRARGCSPPGLPPGSGPLSLTWYQFGLRLHVRHQMVPELPAEYDAWTAPWRGYELHFYSLERVRSLGQPVFARVFLREGLELEVAGRMLVVGHLRWRVRTTGGGAVTRKPEQAKAKALRPPPAARRDSRGRAVVALPPKITRTKAATAQPLLVFTS